MRNLVISVFLSGKRKEFFCVHYRLILLLRKSSSKSLQFLPQIDTVVSLDYRQKLQFLTKIQRVSTKTPPQVALISYWSSRLIWPSREKRRKEKRKKKKIAQRSAQEYYVSPYYQFKFYVNKQEIIIKILIRGGIQKQRGS